MITSTSLTHPTTIAKIRAAVASAVQAKEMVVFVANKAGENILSARWNSDKHSVQFLSAQGDVTDVVKEAFAIVNNKNINKHMAVCLDNGIACPVRMMCVN